VLSQNARMSRWNNFVIDVALRTLQILVIPTSLGEFRNF